MELFLIFGCIGVLAVGVAGFLFYLLSKETAKDQEVKVVPIANPQEILSADQSVKEDEFKHKIDELQEELQIISMKGTAQVQEANALAEQLSKENELLKLEHGKKEQQLQEQLTLAKEQTDQLQRANSSLQTQLEASEVRLRQVQDEGIALRNQMDDELAQSEAVIAEYKRTSPKTEESLKEIEELKSQIESLRQEVQDARMTTQKLKEFNQHLIEKADTLQYELVKHRAQASGLERICENYRMQLEKRV